MLIINCLNKINQGEQCHGKSNIDNPKQQQPQTVRSLYWIKLHRFEYT